jgi:regulator of protease activity HflC (stomatin/prohibitin superfamily)
VKRGTPAFVFVLLIVLFFLVLRAVRPVPAGHVGVVEINQHIRGAIEPRGVMIERMLLRDVARPARLQQAIQEKLSAEQEASRMQFVLLKEKQEAERKKIEAEGISYQRAGDSAFHL